MFDFLFDAVLQALPLRVWLMLVAALLIGLAFLWLFLQAG